MIAPCGPGDRSGGGRPDTANQKSQPDQEDHPEGRSPGQSGGGAAGALCGIYQGEGEADHQRHPCRGRKKSLPWRVREEKGREGALPYGKLSRAVTWWDWLLPALAGMPAESPVDVRILDLGDITEGEVLQETADVIRRQMLENWDMDQVYEPAGPGNSWSSSLLISIPTKGCWSES